MEETLTPFDIATGTIRRMRAILKKNITATAQGILVILVTGTILAIQTRNKKFCLGLVMMVLAPPARTHLLVLQG